MAMSQKRRNVDTLREMHAFLSSLTMTSRDEADLVADIARAAQRLQTTSVVRASVGVDAAYITGLFQERPVVYSGARRGTLLKATVDRFHRTGWGARRDS